MHDEYALSQAHSYWSYDWYHDNAVFAFGDKNEGWYPRSNSNYYIQPKLSHGFVYAASYDTAPGIVKLGLSKFHPSKRLAELTRKTSAPGELKMLFSLQTPFRYATESAAHVAARRDRIKGEFFRLTPTALIGIMSGLAYMHNTLKYEANLTTTRAFIDMCGENDIHKLCEAGLLIDDSTKLMAA
jgi:hypothetical protein